MQIPKDVRLAPTATKIPADGRECVIVCGSHGGAYAGYLIARAHTRALILNDASGGLDDAGLGALALCEAIGMAAATVAHTSARIGDAQDMWARGIISHANTIARAAGCDPGQTCAEAALALAGAPMPTATVPDYAEARVEAGTNPAGLRIVCIDSVSLVHDEEDVGQIVISGSHGALVAGQHGLAIRVKAAFAVYNDAGVGIDDAGISRLPVLDEMGVAAATVSASSARIGDARSMLDGGIISHRNTLARRFGVEAGMTVRAACDLIRPTSP